MGNEKSDLSDSRGKKVVNWQFVEFDFTSAALTISRVSGESEISVQTEQSDMMKSKREKRRELLQGII